MYRGAAALCLLLGLLASLGLGNPAASYASDGQTVILSTDPEHTANQTDYLDLMLKEVKSRFSAKKKEGGYKFSIKFRIHEFDPNDDDGVTRRLYLKPKTESLSVVYKF